MKKMILIAVMMLSGMSFGQSIEPKLEAVGNKVKATYFYDNGKVQQEGYFSEGKLDGKWSSYDEKGSLKAVAEYTNGEKTGKWVYYSNGIALNEVNYSNNHIATITSSKGNQIADKN